MTLKGQIKVIEFLAGYFSSRKLQTTFMNNDQIRISRALANDFEQCSNWLDEWIWVMLEPTPI